MVLKRVRYLRYGGAGGRGTVNKSYIMDREVLNLSETHDASSILSSYIVSVSTESKTQNSRGHASLTLVRLVAIALHSSLGGAAIELKVLRLLDIYHVTTLRSESKSAIARQISLSTTV